MTGANLKYSSTVSVGKKHTSEILYFQKSTLEIHALKQDANPKEKTRSYLLKITTIQETSPSAPPGSTSYPFGCLSISISLGPTGICFPQTLVYLICLLAKLTPLLSSLQILGLAALSFPLFVLFSGLSTDQYISDYPW